MATGSHQNPLDFFALPVSCAYSYTREPARSINPWRLFVTSLYPDSYQQDGGSHYLFARHGKAEQNGPENTACERSSREDKDVIHSKFAVGRQALLAGAARISAQNRSDSV